MKWLLHFLFLFIPPFFSITAENRDSLEVSGIKSTYVKGEPIKFILLNSSQTDYFISFSLSRFSEKQNEWVDQVPDLKNYNCNPQEKLGVNFSLLKTNDNVRIEWLPKKVNRNHCFDWTKNKGKYRIIVSYRPKGNQTETQKIRIFETSTFTIK